MTRNTPRLLTILHFSQIFFTEERTFTITTPCIRQSFNACRLAAAAAHLRYFVL
jgi:hypothetical protein